MQTSDQRCMPPERQSSETPASEAMHVWLVFSKAAHAVERNARNSVAALGLGLSDFAVLEVLLHKGAQAVNVIGKKVLLTSGSIITAVDRLESRKLVHRTPDPQDQRARLVQLTAEGRRIIKEAFRRHSRDMEEIIAVLNLSERLELTRLLKKLGLFAASRLKRRG